MCVWCLVGRLEASQPRRVRLNQVLKVPLKQALQGLPLKQLAQAVELSAQTFRELALLLLRHHPRLPSVSSSHPVPGVLLLHSLCQKVPRETKLSRHHSGRSACCDLSQSFFDQLLLLSPLLRSVRGRIFSNSSSFRLQLFTLILFFHSPNWCLNLVDSFGVVKHSLKIIFCIFTVATVL